MGSRGRLAGLIVLFGASLAEGSELKARLLGPQLSPLPAQGAIVWSDTELPVVVEAGSAVSVQLSGKFTQPGSSLLWKNRVIPLGIDRRFTFKVPLTGVTTEVRLRAVDSRGQVENLPFSLSLPEWGRVKLPARPRVASIVAALGFTSLGYAQTRSEAYSGVFLTGKLAYRHELQANRWDLALSAFGNLVPLMSSRGDGVVARVVGANFRVGYLVPGISDPWRLGLMVGGYYTTMLVTRKAFGYTNIVGPQIFPTILRRFRNGHGMAAYFKFSPISDGTSLLALGNREIATGLSYSIPQASDESLEMSLDLADLRLISGAGGATAVASTSVTAGVGYRW
ncbi:MAG: hypothetical protein NDJ89_11280 [Oligoflexia bacterium]|nr:hypothetical protein [Oligoflexia bacterium]